ncbi:MAG: nucleoside deaminase [Defluviitaleaceae bacterium]|nr:nucleoside deaminase [Defluviitaleaceae bacterium]MCL2273813.1 nucleoside deaminase [Defluviitaleaceae bacterium]
MNLSQLPTPWQLTFDLAWESFKQKSLPIAAVIADTAGNIVSTGRNQIFEKTFTNRKMAHAEMLALINLEYEAHPDIRQYTMYTTTEPCPMCMGTIVMSDVRKVRIAMADPWAGATDMCKHLPYVASKNTDIIFEGGTAEAITAILAAHMELEIDNGAPLNPVAARLKEHQPKAFAVGEKLYAQGTLRTLADKGCGFSAAFEAIKLMYDNLVVK